jgi:predicted flap endonuclease-1-like 5' DNA nuclease
MDSSEWADTDDDGLGDNTDLDDDDDGWSDNDEATCGSNPLDDTNQPVDTDSDAICDVMDTDDDNDGVPDSNDMCPGHDDTLDWDEDGIPDGCDGNMDMDGDGIPNNEDECDNTPLAEINQIDEDGCGPSESGDDDGDNIPNANDLCPDTPADEIPNTSGCGASQRDSDGDGWTDSVEQDCGHDYLNAFDVPDESCAAGEVDSNSDEGPMAFSCWIILILLLIIVLAILMVLSSSRDDEGKITFNFMSIGTTLRQAADRFQDDDDDDPFANLEGQTSAKPSTVDDWMDEPVADTSGADSKIAEMDAKMAEMDAKMAEMTEKEAQLARIAAKAEDIDFATIGTASMDDKNDLRQIKGIGPFIEEKLNALGIFTFAQLANMTPEIEEQVNEAIEFFPGRIKRDKWANQATELDSSDEEEEELPDMTELVSEETDDDETFEDVEWE